MQRFAWILGATGALLFGAFLAYVGVVEHVETPWAVAGGVGLGLVGSWIWLDRASLQTLASTRGARHTTTAVVTTVVAGALAVSLNVVGDRYDQRWDVTASGRFTLAPQTVSVVTGLERDVELLAFFPAGTVEEMAFKDLVAGYEVLNDRLTVRIVDPVREPMLARENEIVSQYGTVVLRAGDDSQRLESDFGESALTNALVRVTAGRTHVICFTEGHGELDPEDSTNTTGLGGLGARLTAQNYTLQKVSLLRDGRVPESCEVLIAADPQVDWMPAEREMVAAHVAAGGAFVLTLDPFHAPELAADMLRYGLQLGDDMVLEQNPNYQLVGGDISYIFLDQSSLSAHALTTPLKGALLLRVARSVTPSNAPPVGIDVQSLAHTTASSWAESSVEQLASGAITPDVGVDLMGPISVAAVAEITELGAVSVGSTVLGATTVPGPATDGDVGDPAADPGPDPSSLPASPPVTETRNFEFTPDVGGRVVVIGDTDFASNELLDQVANVDLLLNTVAWMVGEDDQISIRVNDAASGTLAMTLLQGLFMWLACLLVLPGALLVAAVATWRQRRAS